MSEVMYESFEDWWKDNDNGFQSKGFTIKGVARLAWGAGRMKGPIKVNKTIKTNSSFPRDNNSREES